MPSLDDLVAMWLGILECIEGEKWGKYRDGWFSNWLYWTGREGPLHTQTDPQSGPRAGSRRGIGGALSAVCVQLFGRLAVSGRSRNPYSVVLWASLLFGSRF